MNYKTVQNMKPIALVLLYTCLFGVTNSFCQGITLSEKNISLSRVFKKIERQTDYTFAYTGRMLKQAKKITVETSNSSLTEVLAICLKDQPFTYQIIDKIVIIKFDPDLNIPVSSEQPKKLIDVRGQVINELGEAVIGASIKLKGSDRGTTTNEKGEFILANLDSAAVLILSSVGFRTYEIAVNGRKDLGTIQLQTRISELSGLYMTANTGYQRIPKERMTGSFIFLDSALLDREVSQNILDRLEDVTSGVTFNKNAILTTGNFSTTLQPNQSRITIRGRSTINSNPNSLIVVDNFPYDGDLSTINPNDVESISILKDAAAASIWGAFSGNGVIVITTKRGRYNQSPSIRFESNLTVSAKPDLYYAKALSSGDYIDIERFLYSKGFYSSALATPYSQLSPVVAILDAQRSGKMSSAEADASINTLRTHDVRTELNKYLFQKAVNQQYNLNISGGAPNYRYFLSGGLDKSTRSLIGNSYRRTSLKTSQTIKLFKEKFELLSDISFVQSVDKIGNTGLIPNAAPYIQLADDSGNAFIVPNSTGYRKSFTDTTGGGLLLDWNDRPLDDLRKANHNKTLTEYHINLGLKYRILKGLDARILYQFNKGSSDDENYNSQETWFTRNLINSYSKVNYASHTITRPIPLGGILDKVINSYKSNNIRGQINYFHNWTNVHSISAIAGGERRENNGDVFIDRLYGYNPNVSTTVNVDYINQYPSYVNGQPLLIPNKTWHYNSNDNFISYFANASYTCKNRYHITGSIRKDESNLFGVRTNQKGVPLWSAGIGWDISDEKFYKINWLPGLKLRITDGFQGNVNTRIAALATLSYANLNNPFGAPQAVLNNPPNSSLRWEKVNQINFGVDFNSIHNRIYGSLDYYLKKGTDLIAASPVDPTTGFTSFMGNTADIKVDGVDVVLNTTNLNRKLVWTSNFLFNYALDRVTAYKLPTGAIYSYVNTSLISPVIGRPLYSLYSYKWAGLDGVGNPQIILDGKISTNYSALLLSTNLDNLKYNGPLNPTFFGSIRNNFEWKNFSLSFLITYKLGYYFRKASVSYSSMFSVLGTPRYYPDFDKRWQTPGDEKLTNVPAMIYPANGTRDAAYLGSSTLVEKGDHIRLKDLRFSYTFLKMKNKKRSFNSMNVFVYENNIGVLWRANKQGIDPDYVPFAGYPIYPDPKSISFGITINY